MSVPQVALLGTLAGVLAVIGPIPTGRLVHRIGERAALMLGAIVAIASIIGCLIASTPTTGSWRLWLFAVAILVMSVGDLTWDLGRQTYLADEVPAHLRARAMTLFGGMMRIGWIIGPLIGAAVIVRTSRRPLAGHDGWECGTAWPVPADSSDRQWSR